MTSVIKTNTIKLLETNESPITQVDPHAVSGENNFVTNQPEIAEARKSERVRKENIRLMGYVKT